MTEIHKKNRVHVLTCAAMIIPAAFLFYVVSDLPHVFIITCFGFLLSLMITSTVKYTDRSIIYSILIALVLSVIFNMVFPMKQERFFSIGKLFMSQITIPLLLYIALISTFYDSTPYTLGINAAFTIIVIMLGGDFRQSTPTTEISLFSFLIDNDHFDRFFMTIAVIDSLAMLFAFNLARKSLFHKKQKGLALKKKVITGVALVFAGGLAVGMLTLFNAYKNDLKKLEDYLTKLRRYRGPLDSKVLFSREIDLNRTINSDLRKNSKAIMIRAEGEMPPGYLRGRSYQYYNNGKWREAQNIPVQMNYKLNVDGLAFNAFFIDKDPGRSSHKFEIFPTRNCLADYLFFPANTNRFEIVADRLTYTKNGRTSPRSWEKDGGYTAYVPKIDQSAPFPFPTIGTLNNYLNVPKDLDATLAEHASKINEKYTSNKKPVSKRMIANNIASYLNDNYTYSLDPEPPEKGEDPVFNFLNNSPKGHCELFASSATLLLRHYDIPARYVTGFVCEEPHPSGNYYIARLGNAHAWVEAYLRDEKRWILVEPTPPAGLDPFDHKWGMFEIWLDRLKQVAQKMFADVRRGYIARAVLTFLVEIVTFIWAIFWHPVRGIIITLVIAFLYWFNKHYRKQKNALIVELSKEMLELQKEFQAIINLLGKRTGISKKTTETTNEWLKLIQERDRLAEEKFAKFAELIDSYSKIRFSTNCSDKDIVGVKENFSKFRKIL